MAEVIVRFETNNGLKAYAVDGDEAARRAGLIWPDLYGVIPKIVRPLVDTFMFSLRHGVLPRMLKDNGLPPMCTTCKDKNAAALDSLVRLMAHMIQKGATDPTTGQVLPLNVGSKDLELAYTGMVRRAPEYDGAIYEPAETTLIESPAESLA